MPTSVLLLHIHNFHLHNVPVGIPMYVWVYSCMCDVLVVVCPKNIYICPCPYNISVFTLGLGILTGTALKLVLFRGYITFTVWSKNVIYIINFSFCFSLTSFLFYLHFRNYLHLVICIFYFFFFCIILQSSETKKIDPFSLFLI